MEGEEGFRPYKPPQPSPGIEVTWLYLAVKDVLWALDAIDILFSDKQSMLAHFWGFREPSENL